ncbi:SPFH domain-containing protein [Tistrella mobilis]|uniref:prohibitin family protein n=1 Tax=Tistrella mobilis TaxID=171437 RepID=UPI003556F641
MTVADMDMTDEPERPGLFGRIGGWLRRHLWSLTLSVLIFGALVILFWPAMFITVPAGHAGVVWHRFSGTDVENPTGEGLQVIWPWDRLEIYDVRFQTVTQTYDAITADGLTVATTISFRYRVNQEYVGILHKNVGPEYLHKIIIPEVGSVARARISQYTAEDFYSNLRTIVQNEIYEGVKSNFLRGNYYSQPGIDLIELQDVLIKAIHLPERVAQAIERKVEQYQRQLEYDYRLATEQKEAERKRIEGEGIRMLFDRVGASEIPDYLTWLGINASVQLAQSTNAKVVVIGNKDSGGMPLILGGIDSNGARAATTSGATGGPQAADGGAGQPVIVGDVDTGTAEIRPVGSEPLNQTGSQPAPAGGPKSGPRMDSGESEAVVEGVPAGTASVGRAMVPETTTPEHQTAPATPVQPASPQPAPTAVRQGFLPGEPVTLEQLSRWLGIGGGTGAVTTPYGPAGFGPYGVVPETAPPVGGARVAGAGG